MPEAHRVLVAPKRLRRWLDGFTQRHGEPTMTAGPTELCLAAPDGAEAVLALIWGPLLSPDPVDELLAQLLRPRRLGALLIRKSSHAVGIFEGDELVAHSVGRHYVQGRTKAGGWSQQRYARRRENQAERAYGKAAEAARTMLLPTAAQLDGLILGGDTHAIREVLEVPSLAPVSLLAARLPSRILALPDPNLRVLTESLARFVAVPIRLNEAARTNSPLAQRDDQPGQH